MLGKNEFQRMKTERDKITMVTAYDFPSAKQAEKSGVDMILVGDSLGMVVLGYDSTVKVTVHDMIHHGKAVKCGAPDTFTVVDMPFMSYHVSIEDSLKNAKAIFQETGAQALKVEGATGEVMTITEKLTAAGIPVVAHLGLTPQSVNVLGGYKVQGKNQEAGAKLLEDAKQLAHKGAIAIVLECVPKELAELVTEAVSVPVIGIGAGVNCDGQVLVYHDIMQYGVERLPKFVKPYADFNQHGTEALKSYINEVKSTSFPADEHSFHIKSRDLLPDQKD